MSCPSCAGEIDDFQCVDCGATKIGTRFYYREGGFEEAMAKGKSKKQIRAREDYLICPECGILVPRESAKPDIFGKKYCRNCDVDLEELKGEKRGKASEEEGEEGEE